MISTQGSMQEVLLVWAYILKATNFAKHQSEVDIVKIYFAKGIYLYQKQRVESENRKSGT